MSQNAAKPSGYDKANISTSQESQPSPDHRPDGWSRPPELATSGHEDVATGEARVNH